MIVSIAIKIWTTQHDVKLTIVVLGVDVLIVDTLSVIVLAALICWALLWLSICWVLLFWPLVCWVALWFVVMLSVDMMRFDILRVVMLRVDVLSVMLSVFILSVVAPIQRKDLSKKESCSCHQRCVNVGVALNCIGFHARKCTQVSKHFTLKFTKVICWYRAWLTNVRQISTQ